MQADNAYEFETKVDGVSDPLITHHCAAAGVRHDGIEEANHLSSASGQETCIGYSTTCSSIRIIRSSIGQVPNPAVAKHSRHLPGKTADNVRLVLRKVLHQMSVTHKIWCFIEGDDRPFSITLPSATTIEGLKGMIKVTKSNRLQGVDAQDLKLWKVCYF